MCVCVFVCLLMYVLMTYPCACIAGQRRWCLPAYDILLPSPATLLVNNIRLSVHGCVIKSVHGCAILSVHWCVI